MPSLTRRRSKDAHAESWQIFYGDVQVGTIGIRAGVPVDVDQWGWSCGFYPRSHRLEHHDGTAETFEQARADFEAAWRDYLPAPRPTSPSIDSSAIGLPGNMRCTPRR